MSYVVLQPHSATNPTDKYRVVEDTAWIAHVNDGKDLPVKGEFKTLGEAQGVADDLNEEIKRSAHTLTYKVHIPSEGINKGSRRYYVECSCRSGSPYEDWMTDLDRWIVAHLTGMGQIKHDPAV